MRVPERGTYFGKLFMLLPIGQILTDKKGQRMNKWSSHLSTLTLANVELGNARGGQKSPTFSSST